MSKKQSAWSDEQQAQAIQCIFDAAQQQAVDLIHDYNTQSEAEWERAFETVSDARDKALAAGMDANLPFPVVMARAIEAMFAIAGPGSEMQ